MEVEMTDFSERVSPSKSVAILANMSLQKAIVESGSFYDIPCNWNISAIREANYQSFLNDTGCSDLECLKTLDNDILYSVSLTYYEEFLPSIDGDFMTKHAVELFNEGSFVSVPLLMGGKIFWLNGRNLYTNASLVNNDEGNILISSGSNTTADIQSALTELNACKLQTT